LARAFPSPPPVALVTSSGAALRASKAHQRQVEQRAQAESNSMKFFLAGILAVVLTPVTSRSDAEDRAAVTPVQKVVQMLTGMLSTAKTSKHEEQVQFAAYKQFCEGTTAEKEAAITSAGKQIEKLDADIQAFEADATRLASEITGHNGDINSNTADIDAATVVRDSQHAEYLKSLSDYTESINALHKAIQTLKAQNYDRPGVFKASLLEHVKAAKLPQTAERTIEALLAEEEEPVSAVDGGAPPVDAYKFRSTDILQMLEDLKVTFTTKKTDLEKEEVSRRQNYELRVQDLTSSTEAAKRAIADKSVYETKSKAAAVDGKADLKDVTAVRDSDQTYLTELTTTCGQKSTDFDARQKLRSDEITALERAIEILSSEEVAGAAKKHLPGTSALLQPGQPHATMLAQLRASGRDEPNLIRVAAYLNDQSSRIGSRMLSALAFRARADPFQKVKKMIEDLINKLISQAGEEATHKGWCDEQLATNENTRTSKTEQVATLKSEIETLETTISKLTKSITAKETEKGELEAAVAEKTDLRTKEESENAETVADAVKAQEAVTNAIQVLKTFFEQAGKATSMLQGSRVGSIAARQEPPPIFETAYKGLQSESTGVLGMLEVIHSDFARLEADTKSAEAASKAEYDKFMSGSAVNDEALKTDIGHMKSEKSEKEGKLTETNTNLENAEAMLKTANEYFESLKPTCINSGQTYDERKMLREDEIQALKEALRILNGEDLAALQMQ